MLYPEDEILYDPELGARGTLRDLSPEARKAARQGMQADARSARRGRREERQAARASALEERRAAREAAAADRQATQADRRAQRAAAAPSAEERQARSRQAGGVLRDVASTLLTSDDGSQDASQTSVLQDSATAVRDIASDPGGTLDAGRGVLSNVVERNTGIKLNLMSLRITSSSDYPEVAKWKTKALKSIATKAKTEAPKVPWTAGQYLPAVKEMRNQLLTAKKNLGNTASYIDVANAREKRWYRGMMRGWNEAAAGLLKDSHDTRTNKEAKFGGLQIYPVIVGKVKYTAWNSAFAKNGGAAYAKKLRGDSAKLLRRLRARWQEQNPQPTPAPGAPRAPSGAPRKPSGVPLGTPSPKRHTRALRSTAAPRKAAPSGPGDEPAEGGGGGLLLILAALGLGGLALKARKG